MAMTFNRHQSATGYMMHSGPRWKRIQAGRHGPSYA